MKKALVTIVTILLLIAFGVSAFQIVNYLRQSQQQQSNSNHLAEIVQNAQTAPATQPVTPQTTPAVAPTPAPTQAPTQPPVTTPAGPPQMNVYKEIYDLNNDTVGWIEIPGTKVNYAVMQTSVENRDYYLDHDFYRNSSDFGSIYAREECDINRPSDNITLYGHHMKDGSMFAGLMAYQNKDYWEKNPMISFNTLYEYHTYKIFAVFKTSANLGEGFSYHQFIDAQNEAEFNEFVSSCKQLAFYDTGITPVWGDKMICLSTCEYTLDNGRFVVCAVRIS